MKILLDECSDRIGFGPWRAVGASRLMRCVVLFALLASQGPWGRGVRGQESPRRPAEQDEEVLRVSTSLVQTDVTVLDRKGRPVAGLRPEEFELKVDGRAQPLLFFEHVTAGSAGELAALRSARAASSPANASATSPARESSPTPRGRAVVFFVDDLHLTPEGAARARDILSDYVERRLAPGTPTLIASPSGQVGFLQQFTDERAVLRAAARRVKYQSGGPADQEQPPMSERNALDIERGDRETLDYFVQRWLADNPSQVPQTARSPGTERRATAEALVRGRARGIARRASYTSEATISALEWAAAAPGPAPGRRVLFFISEGFMLGNTGRDLTQRFRRVVDAAARAGTVVYTLDARGLAVPMQDAASAVRADIDLDVDLSTLNPAADMQATQNVLRSLADATGGRAYLGNGLEEAVGRALGETAEYYVLAWRPEGAEGASANEAPKFRHVEVSVKNRPDLTVRVRSGFLAARAAEARAPTAPNVPPDAASTVPASAPAAVSPNAALTSALTAHAERRALPLDLYAVYKGDAADPHALTALVQLSDEPVVFAPAASGRQEAEVAVACVVLDDSGKTVFSEGRTLTLARAAGADRTAATQVVAQFPARLTKPGLYQVRAAARDARGGLVGSAFQWVEVPDLKAGRLSLSTPVVVESAEARPAVALKVDRRFARTSRLRLELYVYNAARGGAAAPDVEMEIKVWRDGRVVLGAPPHRLAAPAGSDPARVRYNAEIPLRSLAPGAYLLEVSASDRASRNSAARQLAFIVE